MMSANGVGGVNRPRCDIWFTDCEGVGSKGARKGFLLGGPRWLSAALNLPVKTALKSTDFSRSYRQKISWLLFMAHGVNANKRISTHL